MPRYLRPIDVALAVAACLATAIVVTLVSVDVVARYVFASSVFFANEVARLAFVWAVFLGFPLALARGRHVGIEFIDSVLSPRLVSSIIRLGSALSIGLLAVIFWKSVEIMLFNWDQELNTVRVSAGLFYLPVVISMAIGILYLIPMLIGGRRALIRDYGGAID